MANGGGARRRGARLPRFVKGADCLLRAVLSVLRRSSGYKDFLRNEILQAAKRGEREVEKLTEWASALGVCTGTIYVAGAFSRCEGTPRTEGTFAKKVKTFEKTLEVAPGPKPAWRAGGIPRPPSRSSVRPRSRHPSRTQSCSKTATCPEEIWPLVASPETAVFSRQVPTRN